MHGGSHIEFEGRQPDFETHQGKWILLYEVKNNIEHMKGKFDFLTPVREPKVFTVYVSFKKIYKNTMFREKTNLIHE